MDKAFIDYFRCAASFADFETNGHPSSDEGYFTFGGAMCYGRRCGGPPASHINGSVPDVSRHVACNGTRLHLPFDFTEVVTNLQHERYRQTSNHYLEKIASADAPRAIYYFFRPILPLAVRKHLQRICLSGWDSIAFPRWPVDATVDMLMQRAMELVLRSRGLQKIPFVWFWPNGAPSCAIMTHDVEGAAGRDFCGHLMDLDDSFGIRSAFQIVPEVHSPASKNLLEDLRGRGFEVNLHDLSHDGSLFRDRQQFLRRAAQINRYARELECRGFRSGAMYREQGWYDAFEFSYDMSVPNVAHLEPQRGGCCTVMPYFVGNVLELPLTTIQDYSLFHILATYSTALWKEQIDLILAQNGLISFIIHPDYLIETCARAVYHDLLTHLCELRAERKLWMALPGDVDGWWRSRNLMTLVPNGGSWRVEGPESHRARVAYATLEDDRLVYKLDEASPAFGGDSDTEDPVVNSFGPWYWPNPDATERSSV